MKIKIVVREKDKEPWQGMVDSVSSTNARGNFDILPGHAHYVGLIEKFLIVRNGNSKKEWKVDRGILSVKDGTLEVYLSY
ncbi:MAG: hypothetical protein UY18_C0039G0006 [Microgenomates group bacterium GW2011_GWF2_47_9]|nr:MAG: hypothetical protein UY18_C0039G0006 [Microgenomates group bacterium GW2011_GWF2_47_9]